MTSTSRAILNIVPAMQAASILGQNVKLARFKKKVTVKKLLKTSMANFISIPLTTSTSQLISEIA